VLPGPNASSPPVYDPTVKILVAGAGGFIGGHLTSRLRHDGVDVRAVDVMPVERWAQRHDVESIEADLRDPAACRAVVADCDQVYDLACDMGGIGFITSNQVECMMSAVIAAHLLEAAAEAGVGRFFFSSSACIYPIERQASTDVVPLREEDAFPANPDGGYGWEKLFTERLVRAFQHERGLEVRIARYHNVYGPYGSWDGGREKAPAAICRKVAIAALTGDLAIDVWGDGKQTRSFMWIDDCVHGTVELMGSTVSEPRNVGSSERVSIDDLITIVEDVAGVQVERRYDTLAAQGVRGRNCDGTRLEAELGWRPSTTLREGVGALYPWIRDQVERSVRP
jgi:GDP-D-mannose 3',5'-epimerase